MSIVIKTYKDPRHIIFGEFADYPQFCATQELVGLIERNHKEMKVKNQVTTINNLVDALYKNWNKKSTIIKQIVEVSNLIPEMEEWEEDIKISLKHSCRNLVDCIRWFSELGLDFKNTDITFFGKDQQCAIQLYQRIKDNPISSFYFKRPASTEVRKAIASSLQNKNDLNYENDKKTDKKKDNHIVNVTGEKWEKVIIHGIFNFKPAIIAAIDDLIKANIDIIFIFNYREDYPSFYKCWKEIYRSFTSPDWQPDFNAATRKVTNPCLSNFYLASDMNDIASGCYRIHEAERQKRKYVVKSVFNLASDTNESIGDPKDVVETPIIYYEFDNFVRFVQYVINNKKKEVFYSPNSRIIDFIRGYNKKRRFYFLELPVGRFFMAIVNMWNTSVKGNLALSYNHSELRVCLESGFVYYNHKNEDGEFVDRDGKLLHFYDMVFPFVENERTVQGVIDKLKKLETILNTKSDSIEDKFIGYMNIRKENLCDLIEGLKNMQQVAEVLLKDFTAKYGKYTQHYVSVCKYIIECGVNPETVDEELAEVLKHAVNRMERRRINQQSVKTIWTLNAIKTKMKKFLQRSETSSDIQFYDFTKVSGVSSFAANKRCHFCFLSDKDMCSIERTFIPWPLDLHFIQSESFKSALPDEYKNNLSWQYAVLKKSLEEYRNFSKFALLYGILFSNRKLPIKLSYVKNLDGKENELYSLLRLLEPNWAKSSEQEEQGRDALKEFKPDIESLISESPKTDQDKILYVMCPYRYVVEGLIQQGTIYRDRYFICKYLEVKLLEGVYNEIINGLPKSGDILKQYKLKYMSDEDVKKKKNLSEKSIANFVIETTVLMYGIKDLKIEQEIIGIDYGKIDEIENKIIKEELNRFGLSKYEELEIKHNCRNSIKSIIVDIAYSENKTIKEHITGEKYDLSNAKIQDIKNTILNKLEGKGVESEKIKKKIKERIRRKSQNIMNILKIMSYFPKSFSVSENGTREIIDFAFNKNKFDTLYNKVRVKKNNLEESEKLGDEIQKLENLRNEEYCPMCAIKDICLPFCNEDEEDNDQ